MFDIIIENGIFYFCGSNLLVFVSNFPCFKAIKFHKLISVRADIGVKIIAYMNHVANDHMIVSSLVIT